MAAILDALDLFLADARQRHWDWASVNCALWVADWVECATGIDPAHDWRGRGNDADDWKAALDDAGGFMPIIGEAMDAGFDRTQSPQRGDVGIISVPVSRCDRMPVVGVVAGICAAPSMMNERPVFVARSIRALCFDRFPLVTAWEVKCKTIQS
jgi:hypothetical protein